MEEGLSLPSDGNSRGVSSVKVNNKKDKRKITDNFLLVRKPGESENVLLDSRILLSSFRIRLDSNGMLYDRPEIASSIAHARVLVFNWLLVLFLVDFLLSIFSRNKENEICGCSKRYSGKPCLRCRVRLTIKDTKKQLSTICS